MNLTRRFSKTLTFWILICLISTINFYWNFLENPIELLFRQSIQRFSRNVSVAAPPTSRSFVAEFSDVSFPFNFLRVPINKKKCDGKTELIVIVLSLASNFAIRQQIRETWASANTSQSLERKIIKVNFVFSISTKLEKLWENVKKEADKFDDLIVTDLPDTYDYLILKVYSLLIYKSEFCANVKYLLKIDEDVVALLDIMIDRLSDPAQCQQNALSCFVWKNALPKREAASKWYIPRTFWPAKYFPVYCNGPIYLLGNNSIPAMLAAARTERIWKLEDVFWTGVVAKKSNISRIGWKEYMFRYQDKLDFSKAKHCDAGQIRFISSHGHKNPEAIVQGFRMLKNVTC